MGFWNNLFRKGEEPEQNYLDEALGDLTWNEDTESWDGEHNGIRFGVSYDHEKRPKEGALIYAREIVLNDDWYTNILNKAKEMALREYPESYRDEINSLCIKSLCFFDSERLHIQFFENDDEPWWFG